MFTTTEKITTDVLVIGGGGAACMAAVAAARKGAKVLLVCKGKTGDSGNTIMVGGSYGMDGESAYYDYHIKDADPSFTKEQLFHSIVYDGFNISNQKMVEQFVQDSPSVVYEVKQWAEEIGEKFEFYPPANWDITGHGLGRALLHGVNKTQGISVYNDCFITDLLKNGNQVTGALGINLHNGKLIEFVSKATILCTGGFQPYSLKSTNTDCTGDGQAMAYRAGAKLADMEFLLFMITAIEPKPMRGSILPALCTFRSAFDYDAVDRFGKKIDIPEEVRKLESVTELCKLLDMYYYGKVLNSERGTANGGFYFDFSRFSDEEIDKMFDAVIAHFNGFYKYGYYHGENIFAYRDLIKKNRRIEVGFGGEYSVGGILLDENMYSGVPGLYAAGEVGCGVFGAMRVADAVTEMLVQGFKAGNVAAEYSFSQDDVLQNGRESIKKAVDNIAIFFKNQGKKNITQLKEELLRISDKTLNLLRTEETLADGVNQYEELEKEFQDVSVKDKCMIYNRELIMALQVKNLLTCAKVAAKMALMRKESRGLHLREDYPFIDNENWQVRLVSSLEDNQDIIKKEKPIITQVPPAPKSKLNFEEHILHGGLGMKNMEDA